MKLNRVILMMLLSSAYIHCSENKGRYELIKDGVVTMPSREILQRKLQAMTYGHFAQKSYLIPCLANQKVHVIAVVNAFDDAFADYNRNYPVLVELMGHPKDVIIGLLLQDAPGALDQLRQTGLYPSTSK